MTLIVPSQWLASRVKQSFLQSYPVKVQYHTINTDVFKPTPSNFRKKHNLENKKIVLGVANVWEERKGLRDFLELAQMLDVQYQIVLVGLSPRQVRKLPNNVLGIPRTNNPLELAQIYTAADVFVNPSREEAFGLTTIEALSCGTKAIVYSGTACEEIANLILEQGCYILLSAHEKELDNKTIYLPLLDAVNKTATGDEVPPLQ